MALLHPRRVLGAGDRCKLIKVQLLPSRSSQSPVKDLGPVRPRGRCGRCPEVHYAIAAVKSLGLADTLIIIIIITSTHIIQDLKEFFTLPIQELSEEQCTLIVKEVAWIEHFREGRPTKAPRKSWVFVWVVVMFIIRTGREVGYQSLPKQNL